jgi:hypothetical protein
LVRAATHPAGNKKEFHMFRKTILTLAASATLGLAALAPTTASADGYGGYGYHYASYPYFHGYKYFHKPWFFGPRFHYGFRFGGWKFGKYGKFYRRYW